VSAVAIFRQLPESAQFGVAKPTVRALQLTGHCMGKYLPGVGPSPSNVVHLTHDNEHGSWLKSEVLRGIRKVGRTLVFHRQQQQIVFLLELQLLQLFACPGWSVNLDFLDAQRSGVFL
jgi:hypothetical protein